MALRVGIDLVDVAEIEAAIADHGERYLDRLFTAREQRDCAGDPARLAARFAVKEAAIKVLRPGPEQPVPWLEIEVARNSDGAIDVVLTGSAEQLAARAGLTGFAASLTHQGANASAVVIAELVEGS